MFFITWIFKDDISLFLTYSSNNDTLILVTFAGSFFMTTANVFFFIYFINAEQADKLAKYQVATLFLNFILSLLMVMYFEMGVMGIAFSQLITGMFIFILLGSNFKKEFPLSLSLNIFYELFKISYPLTPRVFFGVINSQFDKYMIGLLSSVGNVGIYQIGKNISSQTFSFMTAIERVYNPQVYKRFFNTHEDGLDSHSIGKYLTPFFYISVFPAFIISLFSHEIVTILTPAEYHAVIPVLTILCMYYGLLFFGKIFGIQFLYAKKTKLISFLSIFAIFLNIIFNIPMIMVFGVIGAAWATLLSSIISSLISMYYAQRYAYIEYEWEKILFITCVFVLGGISTVLLDLLAQPYYLKFFVKIFFALIFILLGIKYKIISKHNYYQLKHTLFSNFKLRSKVL